MYKRQRERRVVGRFPIENVSDAYRISWSFVDPPEDGEREFNDTVAQAEELDFSQSRRGHIGWEGDRDVYCLLGADASFRVELTAIEELDLKLTLLSRDGARRTVFDQGGLGEPEETDVIEADRAADSCFEVTVAPLEFGARMSLTAYELRLVALTGDGEAAVPD